MTVSLALRNSGKISAQKRHDILEIAEKMGYRADPIVAKVMSSLRFDHRKGHRIGFISRERQQEWKHKRVYLRSYSGILKRAQDLGYELEEISFEEAGPNEQRLSHILQSRGIRGAILGSVPDPAGHTALNLRDLASVGLGYSVIEPCLHRITNHHSQTLREAVAKLRSFGNRRVGCVMLAAADTECNRTWTAGHAGAVIDLPPEERVPVLLMEEWDFAVFRRWFEEYQPDAIAALTEHLPEWLAKLGKRVPEDVQIAVLDREPADRRNAGMDQNHEIAGALAVDLLLSQLYLNHFGIPRFRQVIFVESTWIDGATAGPRA